LRLASHTTIDGLWVGTFEGEPEASEILHRVEHALRPVAAYDPRRYARLRRDLARIWVRLLPAVRAQYGAGLQACELDSRYVLVASVTPQEIATTIVHEATHARIQGRGIVYHESVRERSEAVCRRRELAFARRLPDGAAIVDRLEEWLAVPGSFDFWTDGAFEKRFVDGTLENLRSLGVPAWALPTLRRLRALVRSGYRMVGRLRRRPW
jgi:hypothetical protein